MVCICYSNPQRAGCLSAVTYLVNIAVVQTSSKTLQLTATTTRTLASPISTSTGLARNLLTLIPYTVLSHRNSLAKEDQRWITSKQIGITSKDVTELVGKFRPASGGGCFTT